ncbi:ParA family protein [Brochothrix thermosphacta]|uniref:ParA family protein n=1 Tax=Brochothrix thermosphacta TaxID=2756 RepID=UPI00210A54ED|nr:ParA family protein [Brochothrix thermosphacta]
MEQSIVEMKKIAPKVITIGNYKGGAGKTTNAVMIGYVLSTLGIKTLVVDMDPQSNATKSLMLTRSANNEGTVPAINKTLMAGIEQASFVDLPVEIIPNLSLIPSFIDFEDFPKYIYQNITNEYKQDFLVKGLLDEIKSDYDIIIIDVPPMSKEVTKNAIIASDYVLISLQTQERSLTGAESYVKELISLMKKYDLNLDLLGILQVLHKNNGKVDQYIMDKAIESFDGDNIFNTVVPQMERLKRFDVNGITNNDLHDKKVIVKYTEVVQEFIDRLIAMEGE